MENKNGESIKDILERINTEPDSVAESENGGVLEFEFKGESSGGLVFEYGDDTDAESEKEESPKLDKKPEQTVTEVKEETKPAEVESEEFSIPDAFVVSEKYNTPATPDTPSRIWTTYVPRFTEVSEKYRMVDDPRPARRVYSDVEEEPDDRVMIKVSSPEKKTEDEKDSDKLDPTAEVDGAKDAVVVTAGTPEREPESEQLNVFKFTDAAPEPEREAPERTVEDERRDIEKLFKTEEPEPAPEPEPEPVEETAEVSEPKPEEPHYMIPDPTGAGLSVVDYSRKRHQRRYVPIAPEGATDEPIESPKKLATEFTHQIQREGFVDKFLDSLMSVKIRFFVSLAFVALLIGYEALAAFGVIPVNVISISGVSGALAIFDMLFVACLFVLALPETVRAFGYLFKGKPLPELSLSVGFILVSLYTLVVALGSYPAYPLFGTVFGILALSAVGSSFYRTSADFTAFKLISQNKEKRILDKKMTRSLPDENLALDGLVDEYKSRTTRIFRAGFITDFFKRCSKCAEDSSFAVTVIAASLGVAVVVGAVCYFLAGGLLAAMSALVLVFLLGVPSFTILSHKYSYFCSQNYALSEESTVVGEATYFDYSDVDVIAFEDTEIFGPDDVNLKRFMLYGNRDSMEKAMRQMCSLFSVVGGPLAFIFASSLDNRIRHNPATDAIIENDGLSGDVGGHRISAGTEEYMRRHGIAIPDTGARTESGMDTIKIMYASEDGEVYAKFYIRYSFSEEFTMLLPTLKEERIIPLIYTRDPNVSNELLKALSAGTDCMRVMKRLVPGSDGDQLYRRVSAGIVTYGDKINAINVMLLTKKYKKFAERLRSSGIYATVGGIAIATVASFLGIAEIPVFALGVWQLLWCLVLHISGQKTFSVGKSDDKKTK